MPEASAHLLIVSHPHALCAVAYMSHRLCCCQVEAKSAVPRSQQHGGGNNAQGGMGGGGGKGSSDISRELAPQHRLVQHHALAFHLNKFPES